MIKKFKFRDLWWIFLIFITTEMLSNDSLYHLTHKDISWEGFMWGLPLFVCHVLFIYRFFIRR